MIFDYAKTFNDCCISLSNVFKESFDLTELELGYKLDDDTIKLCILFGLIHIFNKVGDYK